MARKKHDDSVVVEPRHLASRPLGGAELERLLKKHLVARAQMLQGNLEESTGSYRKVRKERDELRGQAERDAPLLDGARAKANHLIAIDTARADAVAEADMLRAQVAALRSDLGAEVGKARTAAIARHGADRAHQHELDLARAKVEAWQQAHRDALQELADRSPLIQVGARPMAKALPDDAEFAAELLRTLDKDQGSGRPVVLKKGDDDA